MPGQRSLDLGRFRPVVDDRPRRWSHWIRHFDRGYRVAVPELADLAGFDGGPVVGFLSPPGWGLRVAGARDLVAGRVWVDERPAAGLERGRAGRVVGRGDGHDP
ncbi:MAG: hypothetical protein ACRDV9_08565 [Acidimicrobiia bacterium]